MSETPQDPFDVKASFEEAEGRIKLNELPPFNEKDADRRAKEAEMQARDEEHYRKKGLSILGKELNKNIPPKYTFPEEKLKINKSKGQDILPNIPLRPTPTNPQKP